MTAMPDTWTLYTPHDIAGLAKDALVIGPFGSDLKTSDYRDEGVPLVFVKDIRAQSFSRPRAYVSTVKAAALEAHQVLPGDILITKMGDPPGDVALYDGDVSAIITADCIRLRPTSGFDRNYLVHSLRTPEARRQIDAITTGAAQKKVSLDRFRTRVNISAPSLEEQKRIAAVLDQVEVLRAKRREAIALLDDLTKTIFFGMFGEPVDGEYPLVQLDDVLERRLRNGMSPSSQGTVESQVLTLSAVTRGRFDGDSRKSAKFMSDPTVDYSVSRRLFMICRGNGNKNLVGRGVFPCVDMDDTAYPDTVLAAPIKSTAVHPVYLEHVWATSNVRRQIEGAARTTNGTYKVNQKTMGAVMFALPGMELQREFAQQVKAVEAAKEAHMAHLATLGELFTSLQHRAFSGTLWDHETTGEAT